MNNTDDSINDKEQSITVPINYSALLAVTRPLVVIQPMSRSLPSPIHEDRSISFKTSDWWVEFALKKGEIICSDMPLGGMPNEESSTTASASPQRGSNVRIRIHLGMS
jgi:hypothetical protein